MLIYFTTKKIEKDIIKKFTIVVMKFPYFIEALPTVSTISEQSIFPIRIEIHGIIISSTSDVTIFWKAAPITTPTARSTTLPFIANSLNSFSIIHTPLQLYYEKRIQQTTKNVKFQQKIQNIKGKYLKSKINRDIMSSDY